jgi:2,3-bisphosphoglycerate-dependent phosphoglycerate mutase
MQSQLILMRHGQSVWNEKNLFTGWVDVPLTEKGIQESLDGGKKIQHIPIDVIFTSTLTRCHMSLSLSMLKHQSKKTPIFQHEPGSKQNALERIYSKQTEEDTIPVYMAWELNERCYGNLQGLNKKETEEKYGKTQVHTWRRSFEAEPPGGESLAMTAERTIPYFQKQILPYLEQGQNVFICAHGNSLRSIIMHLEGLSKEEVTHLELSTGDPIIYTFEQGTWTKTSST